MLADEVEGVLADGAFEVFAALGVVFFDGEAFVRGGEADPDGACGFVFCAAGGTGDAGDGDGDVCA